MSDSSRSSTPNPSESRPHLAASRCRRANVDYGESLTAKLQSGTYSIDAYRWEDDDLSLRSGAAQARLPFDRMTEEELHAFPHIAKSRPSTNMFLFVRNKLLVLWCLDPLVELTVESALQEIPPPLNSDVQLIANVHAFLQRHALINFGVFISLSNMRLRTPLRVVVIGGGASGLAAARQLTFFGFDVIVLEARPRTGGRVMTYNRGETASAELGAQIITGIVGNPITILAKQLPVHLVKISQKCPIYDCRGQIVDPRKDDMIQKSFNKILETCAFIAHNLGVTEIGGKKISLGDAYNFVLDQQELRVQKKRLRYWERYNDLCVRMRMANQKIVIYKNTIDKCMQELRNLINVDTSTADSMSIDYNNVRSEEHFYKALTARSLRQTLAKAMQGHDDVVRERQEMERLVSEIKRMEPSMVYMNTNDRRVLDFHFANLEYANGAPFSAVSLSEWDQDDAFEIEGSHLMVKEGYAEVIQALARDVDVRPESIVEEINYGADGVTIKYTSKQVPNQSPLHLKADAVICTVPLGVLKRSLVPDMSDSIRFTPNLPQWKAKAIASLSYGNLNKVALIFEKPFWDTSLNMIGRLNDSSAARGELFLFFSSGDSPVLVALLAGEAATLGDRMKEDILVAKVMAILASIFPSTCPTRPLESLVTLWHCDRFARGCYSFIGINSSANDYDELAKPICDENGVPRVCFAGEHTNRLHPSTVHGAFISGVREAARISDHFLGSPVRNYSVDVGEEKEMES